MTRPVILMLFGLAALTGCASVKPGQGFDDVQQEVAARASGQRVHWNTGSDSDAEVRAAVAAMLEGELSADQAAQITLLNNHDLQATYEELNIAQADLVEAGLLRNPIFSGELRFDTDGGGTGVALGVAQDFVSLLMMPLAKGRAQASFEAAKVRVTAAVLDTAFESRTRFYEYQAAEQVREMRATVMEATAASYDLAKRLRAAGNITELDLANERSLFEQSKIDLAASEAEAARLRERMNAVMGLWGRQTGWRAATRLPALPDDAARADGLERRAIESSLDLSLLRRDAEIAARTAGIVKPFGWLSDAEVGVAAEREVEGGWSVGPSLSVPIPLFDQGQSRLAAAQARFRQARERYTARAVEIRSRVRAAQSDVLSAFDRARYYERVILPLKQKIVDETQLQYNGMQVSAFQLLQAKRDQIEAGGQYIAALADYWHARSALDQVLSGRMTPFEGGTLATTSTSPFGPAGNGDHE